jgi:protein TonB
MKHSQNQNNSKTQKVDAQRKTSVIFMELGLVFALLIAYVALESKTTIEVVKTYEYGNKTVMDEVEIPEIIDKQIEPDEPVVKPEPQIPDEIEIRDDDDDFDEGQLLSTEVTVTDKIDLKEALAKIPELDDGSDAPTKEYFLTAIEEAPIFPGCKGSKEMLRKCFEKKIQDHVNQHFDGGLTQKLGLESGKKRIAVQFVIDHQGKVTDIEVRAPHKGLEKETIRVIEKLPQMTPGKQNTEPVRVKYSLPITFKVLD